MTDKKMNIKRLPQNDLHKAIKWRFGSLHHAERVTGITRATFYNWIRAGEVSIYGAKRLVKQHIDPVTFLHINHNSI